MELPVSVPIDFTNKPPQFILFNFGKVSKIDYRNGRNLSIWKMYTCIKPKNPMPTIVKDLTFEGATHAMTATEAALYDQYLSGELRSKMVDLIHKKSALINVFRIS